MGTKNGKLHKDTHINFDLKLETTGDTTIRPTSQARRIFNDRYYRGYSLGRRHTLAFIAKCKQGIRSFALVLRKLATR